MPISELSDMVERRLRAELADTESVCSRCGASKDDHCACFDEGFREGMEHARAEATDAPEAEVGAPRGRAAKSGKGSRLRKYTCAHGQIVRAGTDALQATCDICKTPFQMVEAVSVAAIDPVFTGIACPVCGGNGCEQCDGAGSIAIEVGEE